MDILIEATPANARRLLDALLAAGLGTAELIDVDGLLANEITVFNDRIRVDVQTRTPGLSFAEAWSRKETMRYGAASFHVVSKADLIRSERASGRPVDLEDVRMLEGGES